MESEKRFKRGDVREDGMIFWEYKTKRNNKEYWVSENKFNEMRSKNLLSGEKYRNSNIERYRSLKRAQYKACKEKNPEKLKQSRKAITEKYRTKHREKYLFLHRESMMKWRKENPEIARQRLRTWAKKNPEKVLASNNTQRARRRKQSVALGKDEKLTIAVIYKTRKRISDCIGIQFHVDHIYPLAKGGLHKLSNLQLLPAKINIRKKDKII